MAQTFADAFPKRSHMLRQRALFEVDNGPTPDGICKNSTMDSTVSLINIKHSLGFTGLDNVQNQVLNFTDHVFRREHCSC